MTGRPRHAIPAALLAAFLAAALAGPAAAQSQSERERAEELAREGMERIVRALEMLMRSIPQYALPEVNEHGDIIIRRKRYPDQGEPGEGGSDGGRPAKPAPEPDATDT